MKPMIYPVGNGARLFAIRADRFKSELLSVQYALPCAAETAQNLALVFELLRRGTERYPTKALFHRELDDLYASSITPFNRRAGDMQLLGLSADFLGDRFIGGEGLLARVVDMMAELLYHPYFPEGHFHTPYVDSEKKHLRDAIRARINAPRTYAKSGCRKLLCEGEPYALSLIGEEDTVDTITPESLTHARASLLDSVTPTFFYVGNTDPQIVAGLLAAAFALPTHGAVSYRTEVGLPKTAAKHGTEQMPLCQGKLSIGYRTDISLLHPLSPAMVVLNEIFGGSAGSKLFLNVRERRSLCYHCSSTLDLFKGVMFANSGMKVSNKKATEEAIRAEFDAIVKGEITDTELEAAKRSLDHAYHQMHDNPGAMFGFYMGRALVGCDETIGDRRHTLSKVTKAEVCEAAQHVREGASFFLEGTLEQQEDEE